MTDTIQIDIAEASIIEDACSAETVGACTVRYCIRYRNKQSFEIPKTYQNFLTTIGIPIEDETYAALHFAKAVLKSLKRVSKTRLEDWKKVFDDGSDVRVEDVVKTLSNICASCLIAGNQDAVRIQYSHNEDPYLIHTCICSARPSYNKLTDGEWQVFCHTCGRKIAVKGTFYDAVRKWDDSLVKDV